MSIFAELDVSDRTTHVCVVDVDGAVLKRNVVASDPDLLAKWGGKRRPGLIRIVLENGLLSVTNGKKAARRQRPWYAGNAGVVGKWPRRFEPPTESILRFRP